MSVSGLAACLAPRGPGAASIAAQTLELGRAGAVLSGVAGDGAAIFTVFTTPRPGTLPGTSPMSATATAGAPTRPTASSAIEAIARGRPGAPPAWRVELDGSGGPLALSGRVVVAALGGTGRVAGGELRGEPGAVVVALDAATGAIAWKLAIDATAWSVVTSLAATSDGVVVGGSFAGTLRAGAHVVSSAGKSDGFVARVTAAGDVAWLVRVGGPGADAVQGVAAAVDRRSPIAGDGGPEGFAGGAGVLPRGIDRIALAGTFTAGADLLGQPLPANNERSPNADGFVAELDATGAYRWAQTFGGTADDTVAGVAIDAAGRIAVAASARGTVHVVGIDLVASGTSDGLVAWWLPPCHQSGGHGCQAGAPGGNGGTAILLGGTDFDGLRAITAAGDHILVGGFYSGALRLGDRALRAGGGDDAFFAELDASGTVVASWPVSGEGREDIIALTAIPGGFLAGIAHTAAAKVGDDALPAPRDPLSGAAVVMRPVR